MEPEQRLQHTSSIDRAVAAHAQWMFRLFDAINSGESEWTVDGVRSDDQCEFGKWLFSFPLAEKLTDHYRTVSTLHTQFHATASEVLELALTGRTREAEAAIAIGGRFASISSDLTKAMSAWKEAVSEG